MRGFCFVVRVDDSVRFSRGICVSIKNPPLTSQLRPHGVQYERCISDSTVVVVGVAMPRSEDRLWALRVRAVIGYRAGWKCASLLSSNPTAV